MIKLNSRVVLDGACYDDYDDLSIFEHVEGKQNEGDVILLISDHPTDGRTELRILVVGLLPSYIFEHCCLHTPQEAFMFVHPWISVRIPLRPSVYAFEEY